MLDEKNINGVPIYVVLEIEEIAKEIRKLLGIKQEEIIDICSFINKIKDTFENLFIIKQDNYNLLSISNGKVHIIYDYFSKEPSKFRNEFIMNSICYGILNIGKLTDDYTISDSSIIFNKELECLSNAILMPEKIYIKELVSNSRYDCSANVEEMANKFKVKEYSIISRGRDLRIWD